MDPTTNRDPPPEHKQWKFHRCLTKMWMEEKKCSNPACKRPRKKGALALTEKGDWEIGKLESVSRDAKEHWAYDWDEVETVRRINGYSSMI